MKYKTPLDTTTTIALAAVNTFKTQLNKIRISKQTTPRCYFVQKSYRSRQIGKHHNQTLPNRTKTNTPRHAAAAPCPQPRPQHRTALLATHGSQNLTKQNVPLRGPTHFLPLPPTHPRSRLKKAIRPLGVKSRAPSTTTLSQIVNPLPPPPPPSSPASASSTGSASSGSENAIKGAARLTKPFLCLSIGAPCTNCFWRVHRG